MARHPIVLAPPRTVVIMAEDEPYIRMEMAEVLTSAGFEVVAASDAADALTILMARATEVQTLFTDIQMPGLMDGLALAHHVSGRWPWIKLLIASGRASPSSDEMPAGSRFVRKPYRPDHVIGHLRTLVDA